MFRSGRVLVIRMCFPLLNVPDFHLSRAIFEPSFDSVLVFPPWQSDVPEGVIRVHAPLLSKVSMAIQLNSQTKAKDILAKFQYENR